MLKKYLQILDESLDKKIQILTDVENLSKEQNTLIENESSYEDIDANMDKKADLIDEINKMDDGFQAMYDNIKTELGKNPNAYKSEIASLQDKIKIVMEKSTSIEALEARNKKAMEGYFTSSHKDNRQRLTHVAAVQDYYKSANKLNAIVPQFMDQKK